MAKQFGQKIRILYILQFLENNSDEEHPLNAAMLCEKLAEVGIEAERKAIYSDISALTEYGMDIIKSHSPRGWFLASREFEEPEILLLRDAVRTAKFITPKKTAQLVKKLDAKLSASARKDQKSGVFFTAAHKCQNEEIYYIIDTVRRAITEKKKITFFYSKRVLAADRTVAREEKPMRVSPYALTWQDDHYYLIGNYEKYDNLMQLRLDRMRDPEITGEAVRPFREVSEYDAYFDVADYTDKLFGMFSGTLCQVELRCKKALLEQVADRFSEELFIKKVTDEDFCLTVTAAISDALVTWILNYGDQIQVLSPSVLVDMIKNRAQNVLNLYSNQACESASNHV